MTAMNTSLKCPDTITLFHLYQNIHFHDYPGDGQKQSWWLYLMTETWIWHFSLLHTRPQGYRQLDNF